MDPTAQVNPVIMGYSQNDFYWASTDSNTFDPTTCSADIQNAKDMDCTPNTLSSDETNYNQCLQAQLCMNKSYSDWFMKTQSNHSGADGRYRDTKSLYYSSIQTTVNLSIGILGIGMFIYYNK